MILVYHHNDLDGICAAAIVAKKYDGDIKPVPVQYNKDTWVPEDVKNASEVWVVDFTFPDMDALYELAGEKLVWIDHHETARDSHNLLWDSDLKGYRSLDDSACVLAWVYCFNHLIPAAVNLIGDRDMWRFDFENTKPFCAGANAIIDSPLNKEWGAFLDVGNQYAIRYVVGIGNVILKAQETRVKNLFYSGVDIDFHGLNARLVNATSDISELGEYIYSLPEYEIAVMWQVKGDKTIFSLRSNTVNCAEIAKKYGGGGHRGAAGFTINNIQRYPGNLCEGLL